METYILSLDQGRQVQERFCLIKKAKLSTLLKRNLHNTSRILAGLSIMPMKFGLCPRGYRLSHL